ncbi:hypothetical protein [Anaerorhabdus sp.]|uniref:hypothetical protein n=1 Tax=Anaerorhabdus sp. TaxID=1872524 RepID=UPI002FC8CB34
MTKVALFLFNLPILVKLFVILLLFYLYIIACIQFYTIFETHKIKKEEKKERLMHKEYGLKIEKMLDNIIENKLVDVQDISQCRRLAMNNRFFASMFLKRLTSRIRKYTNFSNTNFFIQRKRLLEFVHELEIYEIVVRYQKYLGVYNTLSILGILRDKRSIPVFKKYETIVFKSKNILLGYYVMLGYARMGEVELFKPIFDKIIDTREISSEEMYVGLLYSCEENVIDWQEDALLHGNINHKIIALLFFAELKDSKYYAFAKNELENLNLKNELTEKESEYKNKLQFYLDKQFGSTLDSVFQKSENKVVITERVGIMP